MPDKNKLGFRRMLHTSEYYDLEPRRGQKSGRDKGIKNDLHKKVRRNLILDRKIKDRGIERNIIPSNIIDTSTKLHIPIGLKLSGQIDTLTETVILIVKLYKTGELQKEKQYRKALDILFLQ